MDAPPPTLDRLEQRLARVGPWVALLLAAGGLAFLVGRNVVREAAERQGDTRIYQVAGERYRDGANIYTYEPRYERGGKERITDYSYPPPFAAVCAAWMPSLPYRAVRAVWLVVCVACAVATCALALGLLRRHGLPRRPWLLGLLLLPFLIRFGWNDLIHGQVNWVVALLLTGAIALSAERRRDPWTGALLGLALVIKPTAWPLLAWWLLERRWRLAGACALAGGLALALPGLRYGPGEYALLLRDWVVLMEDFARWKSPGLGNASLGSAFVHLLVGVSRSARPPEPLLLALPLDAVLPWVRGLSLAVGVALLAACWRWRRADPRVPPALLVVGALVSPVTWKAHLVVLVAPALWALRPLADGAAGRRGWVGYGAALLLFVASSPSTLGLSTLDALGGLALGLGLLLRASLAGALDR